MSNKTALFTENWMRCWQQAINQSSQYKKNSKGWVDPILLEFSDADAFFSDKKNIGFRLSLNEGYCNEIRFATSEDLSTCPYILSTDSTIWTSVVEEKKDPLFLLMKGSLKLKRGSLMKLTNYRNSAKSLLEAASSISETKLSAKIVDDLPKPSLQSETMRKSSVTKKGLDFNSFPMQLFQKSKQLGIWNPSDINLEKDKKDWLQFSESEKTVLIHLTSMFLAGEEAVTLDLLPLIQVVASEGRIEEEIYLTSFLWEEAKHTEFFSLFFRDVIAKTVDLEQFHGPHYKKLFYEELHTAMSRLNVDKSPEAQLKASITYNMIVEGTLAETGYEAYYQMLTRENFLPGLREGIGLLKRDESRHIAYGLHLIKRLIDENPKLMNTLEEESTRLIPMAIDVVHEIFEPYDVMPFGLEKEWYIEYASNQFSKRIQKLTA